MQNEKIIQIVKDEFELFNDSIKEALTTKRINTTKEAYNSLRVEVDNNSVKSIGIFYLEFLDTGRGPGKKPPFAPILKWVMDKTGLSKNEAWGLAIYVQNKIADVGTEIFRYNSEGIELNEKVELLRQNLKEKLSKEVKFQLIQRLDKYKKIFISKQKFNLWQ